MNRILSLVRRCVEDYEMIAPNDRIAVGVSGGKDSLMLLMALAKLREFYPIPFQVEAFTLDMGHADGRPGMDFAPVARLCRDLDVPFTLLESEIHHIIFDVRREKNPCSMCAKMRRGALHNAMLERDIHKIALGHHLSDVLETTLLGLFYGAQLQTMPPKLRSKNFPGMELIRPLYCVHEDAIIAWKNYNHLQFLQCACRFTEEREAAGDGVGRSKRQEIKFLLRELKKTNPNIEKSIFQGINGLQLDTFPGFKHRGVFHSFPELYNHPDWFAGETKSEEISEEL